MREKESKIRVAFIDHHPEVGGAESSLLTFLQHIDRRQFEITVVLNSEGAFSRMLRKEDIPVKIIPLPTALIHLKRRGFLESLSRLTLHIFDLQVFLIRLLLYLKKNRFQLILTNTVKAHLYGSIVGRIGSIPVLWRFHDLLSPQDFSPLLIKVIALWGRRFPKKIMAVSNSTRESLVQSGVREGKIEVIFHGLDHERWSGHPALKDIRKEFDLGQEVRFVGCVGRVLPQKGQKSFLLAVPEVIRKYPETLFLIVGDVPSNERSFKEELLKIVKENKIEGYVKFTGFRSDISDVLQSLDIVVFPSIAPESFGLSVLEAMSAGKAVIATNTGGVCEMINDGINGMIIEEDHPEQIADRIIYLLNHREARDRMGEEAKTSVHQKFSLERSVRAIEIALQEAVREVNP